jgi:SAM-dependent methyltransferase
MIKTLRKMYHIMFPENMRKTSFLTTLKMRILGHDYFYDELYYVHVEEAAQKSANIIATDLLKHMGGKTIIDVGCGTGALLEAFKNKGCDVHGLERSHAAIKYCKGRGVNVTEFDINNDEYSPNRIFDIAISTEVAEHLPASSADKLIDLLCNLSGQIAFTATPPGGGGMCHINEQPNSYWISKFSRNGYKFDEKLSLKLKKEWKASNCVESWYYENIMIFRKSL